MPPKSAFSDLGGKMSFLGHNFSSRHARRSSKGSIDAGNHLVFKKRLNQNCGPLDWRPGPVKVGQKKRNTPTLRASPRRTPHPNQKIFFNRTKKSCCIRRGFEQLSSYSGWRVITKKPRANLLTRAVVKVVENLISSGIEDHTLGPTNVREHFPEEELTLGKSRLLKVASLVE